MWGGKKGARDFSQAANVNACLLKPWKEWHDGWKLLSDREGEKKGFGLWCLLL